MNKEIQIFNNPNFGQIRMLEVNGQPYFVGYDVALALGYAKPRNAISQHVDNEDALKQGVPDNQGFTQETTLINESGVYALIFGSKLPKAKAFKRWVTGEVLPSIRKTGSYSVKPESGATDRKSLARMVLESERDLEEETARSERLEGELRKKEEELNRLKGKMEAMEDLQGLKELIVRLASGASRGILGSGKAARGGKELPETPNEDIFRQYPEYRSISVPIPTPDDIYNSMTFENVRKRLYNDLGIEFSPVSLSEYMEKEGFVTNDGNDRLKPTKKAVDCRLVLYPAEIPDKENGMRLWQPKFTERGYSVLVSRIREHGAFDY